jgi:YhcH/YjgK/YiaL family protein
MIYDHISNATLYTNVHPRFAEAFAFLARQDLDTLPAGRVDILGDEVYALVQKYDTHPPLPGRIETHRKYIDIQFVLRGQEHFGIASLPELTSTEPYDEKKDIAFFSGELTTLPLPQDHFIILHPNEPHAPGLTLCHQPVAVTKIVVKVKAT